MSTRKHLRTVVCAFPRLLVLGAAAAAFAESESSVPLYEGLGRHHREVTTAVPLAQRYFDQGLTWAYAFNHDEAIRAFTKAAALDPDCAMAWWGIALCNGPHINNPVLPPERAEAAWDALQKALAAQGNAAPVERALIEALARRYADPAPADRAALDRAYADAMAAVWERYPTDADVGALYAESLMDLRPWDLWSVDRQPRPETPKLIAVLEQVLRLNPEHPGAGHFYIHTMESSPTPEKAAAVADRLKTLVPAAGHLVHMPTHIYVLTGRWAEASDWNVSAMKADREYREISPRQGFYHVYMLHNAHMLSFASAMEGRGEAALEAARAAVGGVPTEFIESKASLVDPYMGAVYDALKRFGRWDDLLKEPAPPSKLPITTAMWRMHRAVAYAAKGEVNLAEQERTAFQKAAAQVPPDAYMAINKAADILYIAEHFLSGEIAYRRGDIDESVRELRAAIAREDQLRYMEPPEWVQPVRHTLGAVLVSAKRYAEAEKVYREDLAKWPENGWSLHGLARCLREQDKATEAQEVEARFQKAWSRADTPIESSCKCVAAK